MSDQWIRIVAERLVQQGKKRGDDVLKAFGNEILRASGRPDELVKIVIRTKIKDGVVGETIVNRVVSSLDIDRLLEDLPDSD